MTSCFTRNLLALPAAERMPRGGPLRAEVFAHAERARHLVALELARERVRERRAVHLADIARHMDIGARYRAGAIAGGEIALMRADKLIALLFQVQHVIRASGGELDTHVPAAGEIGGGRLRLFRIPWRTFRGENLVDAIGDDLHVAGHHHECRDRDAGLRGLRAPAASAAAPASAAESDARLRRPQNVRDFVARDAELCGVPIDGESGT